VLDIETEPARDSYLKPLAIQTFQFSGTNKDDKIESLPLRHKKTIRVMRMSDVVVYNAPFEQTQLTRSGVDVWKKEVVNPVTKTVEITKKKWTDVALMARCFDNRLMETRKTKLEDVEEELLGNPHEERPHC